MAKKPTPKSKKNRAQSRTQRTKKLMLKVASLRGKYGNLVQCKNCQDWRMPHRVCESCGQYRGKQIIVMKAIAPVADVTEVKA